MLQPLGTTRLKTGESVECGIVLPPAADWTDRVEALLRHKGDPWNWQNSELLRRKLPGIEARFFVLHRAGRPFANILLAEAGGVGLVGHVWTEPADRGAGASSLLLERVLEDFRHRGGRALFLGTDPGSAAWQYYRRRGFVPIAEGSGSMVLYFEAEEAFARAWFDSRDARVAPLAWRHWPAAVPLFLGDFAGAVRVAASGLFGRCLSEGPLLPLLRAHAGEQGLARVLEGKRGAVLGFASAQRDPFWPDRTVVDVFCHPDAWPRAPELLAALALPAGARVVSYSDATLISKREALHGAGFRLVAELPQWVQSGGASGNRVAVVVYEKILGPKAAD